MSMEVAYLVPQSVPMMSGIGKVNGRERETNFSEELISAKPVPVPHAQPQGA